MPQDPKPSKPEALGSEQEQVLQGIDEDRHDDMQAGSESKVVRLSGLEWGSSGFQNIILGFYGNMMLGFCGV